jgi:hypothetical protein
LEAGIEGGLHAVLENARRMGGMCFTDGEIDEDELTGDAVGPEVEDTSSVDSDESTSDGARGAKRARLAPVGEGLPQYLKDKVFVVLTSLGKRK